MGKEKMSKTKRVKGFNSLVKKAPSKCRPSTRVRWVGRVLY